MEQSERNLRRHLTFDEALLIYERTSAHLARLSIRRAVKGIFKIIHPPFNILRVAKDNGKEHITFADIKKLAGESRCAAC